VLASTERIRKVFSFSPHWIWFIRIVARKEKGYGLFKSFLKEAAILKNLIAPSPPFPTREGGARKQ
jgi:hypothetical protein